MSGICWIVEQKGETGVYLFDCTWGERGRDELMNAKPQRSKPSNNNPEMSYPEKNAKFCPR